jgi:riboflavin biosynthesis pyrimidine reductase
MQPTITRLFPPSDKPYRIKGLYLEHGLHRQGTPGHPFVYSNFITSLDGRIAVATAGRTSHEVPAAITNERDWRLYQELAGQADLLITSGRFLRQAVAGEAQDQLPVGRETAFSDIIEWRKEQGLAEQPDIAIMSSSLDIPVDSLVHYRNRRLLVITGNQVPDDRARQLTKLGIDIVQAGSGRRVSGRKMIEALDRRGYHSIYSVAGPGVFHTLVEANVLDRLYLTMTHQLLSGNAYDTFIQGDGLSPARGMQLVSLYHDAAAPAGASQWFTVFEPKPDRSA